MSDSMVTFGMGTEDDPWQLETPSRTSSYEAYRDEASEALVVRVGKTVLSYELRCLDDLHAMLVARGDWMALGNADEGKPVKPDTVEAWARDASNPVGGYYGRRKGYRGRFANYVTPVLEMLGNVELEHKARGNRVRARSDYTLDHNR
ncbi:MAG: DUF6855 family protein [Myxococcota bacterium]